MSASCFLCDKSGMDIIKCKKCEVVCYCKFHEKYHRTRIEGNDVDQAGSCFPIRLLF